MSKSILLADDSLTIQKVVELTFMEGDFEVTAVSNGDDAVGKLGEMNPDIVIADVHMPGADGYQICRVAKERHPGVPVLLLVGTFEPFEEGAASECGAEAHLKKPFDSQELLRLVEDLLGEAASRQDRVEPAVDEIATSGEEEAPAEPVAATDLEETYGTFEAFETDESSRVQPPEEVPETLESSALPAAEAISGGLSEEDVDRIARRVVELIGDQIVREISWDVIPDLAEIVIKDRIRELESQVE